MRATGHTGGAQGGADTCAGERSGGSGGRARAASAVAQGDREASLLRPHGREMAGGAHSTAHSGGRRGRSVHGADDRSRRAEPEALGRAARAAGAWRGCARGVGREGRRSWQAGRRRRSRGSNNAGLMTMNCTRSCDGLELHFATNHIGHFLLTNLLLENMKSTCRDTSIDGQIVNVSSLAHVFSYPEGICFEKIRDPCDSGLKNYTAYCQSKLANILHSNELFRIFKEEGVNISANSVHPGVIRTNIFRERTIVTGCRNNMLCGNTSSSEGVKWKVFRQL